MFINQTPATYKSYITTICICLVHIYNILYKEDFDFSVLEIPCFLLPLTKPAAQVFKGTANQLPISISRKNPPFGLTDLWDFGHVS
jgi:hypothetical protein